MELSLLCGASIFMIIKEDKSQQIAVYSSDEEINVLSKPIKIEWQEEYTNKDVRLLNDK